ncbi:MAG: hypothetical protein ACJA2G_002840 [Cognaticolwellia sp.]|jgi:hypothetical protein
MKEHIDPLSLSRAADKAGKDGSLASSIRESGQVIYQPSPIQQGLLEAMYPDGQSKNGRWQNGKFVPEIEYQTLMSKSGSTARATAGDWFLYTIIKLIGIKQSCFVGSKLTKNDKTVSYFIGLGSL